jgi:7,8-dihydropterin-6-yl-methyl-4-(beta-D-ribofuranosyl)aminobenzene 5'-phosphate synthase
MKPTLFLLVFSGIFLLQNVTQSGLSEEKTTITIVYDNVAFDQRLSTDWGFAAWIQHQDHCILFDTGTDPDILLNNLRILSFDPKDIDIVVISHAHGDHSGGLSKILELNPNIKVFLLEAFPSRIKRVVEKFSSKLIEVKESCKLLEGIYTTGEMGTTIKEQSLVIYTESQAMVLTGCAHPGIDRITEAAGKTVQKEIVFAMGGFHLLRHDDKELINVFEKLREQGLDHVAPSHCTGEEAINAFRTTWKEKFILTGCGARIQFPLE